MDQEEVWDAIAGEWKEFRSYEVSHILDFLKGKKGRVLDLGCGSGRNFVRGSGLEFYGVDFSKRMVELSRERGIAKEVKKGDVGEIPYGDGFFDCVVFSAALHCVDSAEKRKNSLEEVYRVLKVGGEALISVWGRGQNRLKNREKEGFVPWTVGEKKFERYTYIYDLDELIELCEGVGFDIVSSEEGENINVVVRKLG
jgi:ubiquinone/menaquinone biosynthesis C-methylase UbiE